MVVVVVVLVEKGGVDSFNLIRKGRREGRRGGEGKNGQGNYYKSGEEEGEGS